MPHVRLAVACPDNAESMRLQVRAVQCFKGMTGDWCLDACKLVCDACKLARLSG